MNTIFAVVMVAAVIITSSFLFSESIEQLTKQGSDALNLKQSKHFMANVDVSIISLLLAENGSTRKIKLPDAGQLSVSETDDVVNYTFTAKEKLVDNVSTEQNIQLSQSGSMVTLILNYSGSVDIAGNVSTAGGFIEAVREGPLIAPQVRFRVV